MAIVPGATSTASISGTTVTVTKPTGVVADDVLVALWQSRAQLVTGNMTLPSGWVEVAFVAVVSGPSVKLAYKVCGGSEPPSYNFVTSSSVAHSVAMARYTGVDTTTPSDVAASTNSGTSGINLTATSITTVTDGAMLIGGFANHTVTGTQIVSLDLTERVAVTSQCRGTLADAIQATAGEPGTGIKRATQGTSARWVGILWALRPAPTVDVTVTVTDQILRESSNLELGCTLIETALHGSGTYATTGKASLQGVFSRICSFIAGFGWLDPLRWWDGTGSVPTVGETRVVNGEVQEVFETWGIDRPAGIAAALGAPIDWIIWRLPWQFTESGGVPNTSGDYWDEARRLRTDATTVANYTLYIRRLFKYIFETYGACRIKVGSEMKGYQPGDNAWNYTGYHHLFSTTSAALLLAADDAVGVTRADIRIGGPYPVVAHKGGTTTQTVALDTYTTATAPAQAIRYASAVGDSLGAWSMKQQSWGNVKMGPALATAEHFKLCDLNNVVCTMYSTDFGMFNDDRVIKNPDDFYVAEQRTRDHLRWGKRLLLDLNGGEFADLVDWIDITEIYFKAQGTVAETNNTLLGTDPPQKIPGPYFPEEQWYPYMAAIKAVGLAVCVEEGARTPCIWSHSGNGDGRTAPAMTGNQNVDEQRYYCAPIIRQGVTGAGTLTATGQVYKWINQHFSSGVQIRVVSVSDTSKVYALASPTHCMVVNKTNTEQLVEINGTQTTLGAYETDVVQFETAYAMSAATGTYTLTGRTANLRATRKIVAALRTFALTGVAASLERGLEVVASAATFALTGQSARLLHGYEVAAVVGAYTLIGQNATLTRQLRLVASAGTYTLSGQDATLRVTRLMAAAQTAYVFTGNNAMLIRQPPPALGALVGSFALTAPDTRLLVAHRLVAAQGSFALTGQTALLLRGYPLTASAATFALTGQAAGLRAALRLVAAAGDFALGGQAATLLRHSRLVAASGAYSLAGNDATLTYTPLMAYVLVAAAASYSLSGQAVTLTWSQEDEEPAPPARIYAVASVSRVRAIPAVVRTVAVEAEEA